MDVCWLRKLLILSFVSLVCTNVPFITQAQEEGGTVNGFVGRSGVPSIGMKIVVSSHVMASYEGTALTDENGYFSVSGTPVGGKIEVYAINENDQVIGKGNGMLNSDGQTITVDIEMVQ